MNTCTTHPRRRRRRTMLGAVGLALATMATTFAAAPASAAPAPLVTEDGIGIRIDENAILGPALQAIEDELQPFVNDRIYQGAWDNSVMDNPDWVQGSADLDLSIDFIDAGTPGYPQGGLKVRGDLRNIMMRFYRYGAWWQPECQFRVNPADGWIEATAKIDTTKLPNAPLTIEPIQAYWDNDPDITREKGNFLCTGYLLDEWWDGLWGNRTDVAAQLEAEMDDVAQDMIDDLWAEYVTPVVDSLEGFGIGWGQVRTDDHGLIVTADVDASAGVTIPGMGGPFDVSDTPDSGATSDVNALLAARKTANLSDTEVTVSVHPNVAAQYMNAIMQFQNGVIASTTIPDEVKDLLLLPADQGSYPDGRWIVKMDVIGPPEIHPNVNGAPVVMLPQVKLRFLNTRKSVSVPVATFEGSMDNIALVTEVRPGTTDWGPGFDTTNATLSVTRTQVNDDAALVLPQDSTDILPYAQVGFNRFNNDIFVAYISLAPLAIGGLDVDLCTTCGRFTGDQRYTELFAIS